jgi:hypothetical protein
MNKKLHFSTVQTIKFVVLVFCLQIAPPQGHAVPPQGSGHVQTLKWVWAGDARASDGTFLEMNDYETADGTQVGITRGTFKSSKAAEHELKLWLKSIAITTKTPKRDDSGRIIGTRAEASFSTAGSKRSVILWTERENFVWISSFSMPLCRQMEAQINSERHR